MQLDQDGVPPTTIREVSLLKVLGRSNHIVKLLGAEQIDEDGKSVLYLVRPSRLVERPCSSVWRERVVSGR